MERDAIVGAVDAYLAAVLAGDGAAASLFAEDGTVEDPIGSQLRRGADEIRAFYAAPRDIRYVRRLGPVTVHGSRAAFQFAIGLRPASALAGTTPGVQVDLVITDILTFGADGLIQAMVGIPDASAAAEPGGTEQVVRQLNDV